MSAEETSSSTTTLVTPPEFIPYFDIGVIFTTRVDKPSNI